MIGEAIDRREDYRLITGSGTFVDDINPDDALYVSFVRSPYGHALINSISSRDGKGFLIFTGKDIDATLPMVSLWEGTPLPRFPLLAKDEVLYSGQLVAAVVSESKAEAEDAAELIDVEYQSLPVVMSIEDALNPNSPVIHPELDSNVIGSWRHGTGDFEAALAKAEVVVEEKFSAQRVTGQAIEPRGAIARYDSREGKLTLWITSQCPHLDRTLLAEALKISEINIKVLALDVGGGFGINSHLYPEQILTCVLAVRTGRPVKWIENRSEHVAGAIHSGDCVQWITMAATRDGRILGLKDRIVQNAGAYLQTRHIVSTFVTAMLVPGPYKIPIYSVELQAVFSNKGPVGTYRAFGMTQATFARERTMDILARKIGIDPIEVRMKNLIKPDEFPYQTSSGLVYDSGNYQSTMSKALELANYYKFRKEKHKEAGKSVGIGIGLYIEIGGVGSLNPLPTKRRYTPSESSRARLENDGRISLFSGSAPTGQGLETTLSQIVAGEMHVPIEQVRLMHGDTDACPYSGDGTIASRSANMAGNAAYLATLQLKQKMSSVARNYLQLDPEDKVIFKDGEVISSTNESKRLHFADLSRLSDEPLEVLAYYEPKVKSGTTAYGVQIAVVEIDEQTGHVKVRKLVTVHDCGNMLNPRIVEGMSHGGTAQGVSAALLEEVTYGEEGSLLSTTFGDYLIPTSLDIPELVVDHTVTPSPTNPLGVKGGGEGGIIGAPAAIANAVYDALFPEEVKLTELPIRPDALRIKIARFRSRP